MWCVLSTFKLVCPDVFREARESHKIQIIGISNSHFCELACWTLDAGKIAYQEHAYMPGQHILPTMVVRIGGKEKHLSKSSKMCTVTSTESPDNELLQSEDNKPNASSVPIAVLPDGTVLNDSWEIAAYSGLKPIDEVLKKWLDEELGPLSRQLAYGFILKPSNSSIVDEMFTNESPWWWRCAYVFAGGAIKEAITNEMKPFDASANKICREKLEKVVEQIGQRITAKQTRYLGGDSLGVADIAVASLMAPLISPPQYVRGRFALLFDNLLKQDKEFNECVQYWRSTVAGGYALDIYDLRNL